MYTLNLYGREPRKYQHIKEYAVGTGYVALYNDRQGECALCRYLGPKDTLPSVNVIMLDNHDPVQERSRPVIVITEKAADFEETDQIVLSYKRALDQMAAIMSKAGET